MSAVRDLIAILESYSLEEPAMTQAELVQRLNRPKATISRVLKELREARLLDYDPATRKYSPGIRLFELGQICRSNTDFLDLVYKQLQRVCQAGGHTGYVTVFDGADIMVLRAIRGSSPLSLATKPGSRSAAHATSNGRAMLSLLSEKEWKERLPDPLPYVSDHTPASHEELTSVLGRIRASGRSYASNEIQEGISSQGIALRDPDTGEIIGIAISYPKHLETMELRETLAHMLDTMRNELLRYTS